MRQRDPVTDPRLAIPRVRLADEAWGDDDAYDEGASVPSSSMPTSKAALQRTAGQASTTGHNVSLADYYPPPQPPYSLEALCITLLINHLPELLECGSEVIGFLPPPVRAALAASARRRNALTNAVLDALMDSEWDTLDVAYTPKLTDRAILAALQGLPHLRFLDVSRSAVSAATLRQLPQLCPKLEVLRIGGTKAADAAALDALKRLLPAPPRLRGASVQDSWEEAADALDAIELVEAAGAVGQVRGLPALRYLVWPQLPHDAARVIRERSPLLQVNPQPRPARLRQWPGVQQRMQETPPEAVLEVPLDQRLVGTLPPAAWQPPAAEQDVRHIAERFKRAYEERAARLALRAEKAARQQRRRAERAGEGDTLVARTIRKL